MIKVQGGRNEGSYLSQADGSVWAAKHPLALHHHARAARDWSANHPSFLVVQPEVPEPGFHDLFATRARSGT